MIAIYESKGVEVVGRHILDPAIHDILDFREAGKTYKECAEMLAVRHRISINDNTLRAYFNKHFKKVGTKTKKTLGQLHSDIKRLHMLGLSAEDIAIKITAQEDIDYTKQIASIAAYIKCKGMTRPGEVVVEPYYKVESKGLITNKWTSEIIAEIAA